MNEQWISDVINKAMEIGRQQISLGQAAPEQGSRRQGTHGSLDASGSACGLSQGRRALLWI